MSLYEYIILFVILIILSVMDIRYRKVSDKIVLLGLVVRMVFICAGGIDFKELTIALYGAFGIMCLLLPVLVISEKFYKKTLMGGGDLKLLFMSGFYVGFDKILTALFWALVSMLPVSVNDLIKKRNKLYPFVPSITLGVVLSVLLPTAIEAYNLSGQI